MSSIVYYSNFCEHSKKLLQSVSKTQLSKDIHFICIDKRVKEKDGKTYIVLENGQKIIMPENVVKVPAILLLNDNFKVIYGESINQYLKPKQEEMVKESTNFNMEPMAFSLGNSGFFGGVVSDNFSFLDMDSDALTAKGDGGLRQMHQYVALNDNMGNISTPADEHKRNPNLNL
jgi:hypothetical protein